MNVSLFFFPLPHFESLQCHSIHEAETFTPSSRFTHRECALLSVCPPKFHHYSNLKGGAKKCRKRCVEESGELESHPPHLNTSATAVFPSSGLCAVTWTRKIGGTAAGTVSPVQTKSVAAVQIECMLHPIWGGGLAWRSPWAKPLLT